MPVPAVPAQRVCFRVLGPLEASIGGDRLRLGGPLEQCILLRLLLARGRPLSVDRLAEELWQDEPSIPQPGTVHAYVARLRRRLGPARDVLTTGAHGYVLEPAVADVDAWRFDRALTEALAAGRRADTVHAVLTAALQLWTDTRAFGPLADRSWMAPYAQRLQERRLVAIELLARAELDLGCTASALLRLQDVVLEHPHRESMTSLVMVALYRQGRQAEALAAHDRCRRALAEDLGISPSPEITLIHQAVLQQSDRLGRLRLLDHDAGDRR